MTSKRSNGWLSFVPILAGATFGDRLLACIGAFAGIAAATYTGVGLQASISAAPYLFASIGASAVLVFAVPASPLAQPWPVIGGNVVSAFAGVATAQLVDNIYLAGALSVSAAIIAMSVLRCLHPPGGGTALVPVLGGPAISALGYSFALTPVATNAFTLVLIGLAFHRFTHHSYPHRAERAFPQTDVGVIRADIDRALADTGETFDISPDDLEALLTRAERYAEERERNSK